MLKLLIFSLIFNLNSSPIVLDEIKTLMIKDFGLKKEEARVLPKKQSKKPTTTDWFSSKKSQQDNWVRERVKLLKQWRLAKRIYRKRIKKFKKTTFDVEYFTLTKKKKSYQRLKEVQKYQKILGDFHVIENVFSSSVKNQLFRPTCGAFSAIKGIEILAAREGQKLNLSEQFFYYLSKPKCQSSPCKRAGSWPEVAFRSSLFIPEETKCPYETKPMPGNETQIPLSQACYQGVVRLNDYEQLNSEQALLTALDNNHPVIGAFKLNRAFFKNDGYVFELDNKRSRSEHGDGHAVLIVGYLSLPNKLHRDHGTHCFLAANSWGKGWGMGGYSCLSSRWIEKYRLNLPFLELKSVSFKE